MTKQQPIKDVVEIGTHKYNIRVLKDNGDGSLLVEHSVFTGKGDDRRFLGNVQTTIYAHNAKGFAFLRKALEDLARADKVCHDYNRQALSDSKNEHRTAETRTLSPMTQLKRKLKADVTAEQRAKVLALFNELGIDASKLAE